MEAEGGMLFLELANGKTYIIRKEEIEQHITDLTTLWILKKDGTEYLFPIVNIMFAKWED